MERRKRGRALGGDRVDRMLEIWKHELPEIDLATEGIIERIEKINRDIDRAMNATLSEFDLDRGEWRLLGALRRSGPPYRRSPGMLAKELELSSGAMTNRLDQLEKRGLIRRLPDPDDRRALKVELTDAGWQAWQDSTSAQARKEELVASALDAKEKEQLNSLLRRMMLELEKGAVDGRLAGTKA